MKRLTTAGAALMTALAISACGGGSSAGTKSPAPGGGSDTVSVQRLSGVGRVLVDRTGKPVYASDQEANGQIVCSGGCTAFWKPVTAAGARPMAGPDTGKLGTVKRPDGTMQVTARGRPLYTFSEDSPGKATGDGFSDVFGGRHFTWHVVRTGGVTGGGDSGGAARSTQGSGNEYGY